MEDITEAISRALVDGQLPCAVVFEIAETLGVEPLQVGEEADRLDVRLSHCQLGLFGWGPKAEGKYRRVKPLKEVPPALAAAIRAALGKDSRLACVDAWRIAAQFGIAKQTVADAAEGLELRVSHCQLGAF